VRVLILRTPEMDRGCEECHGFVQSYMVKDSLWLAWGLHENSLLCLACLEKRIGRKLAMDDLQQLPWGIPVYREDESARADTDLREKLDGKNRSHAA
jgi:hypothetical protein